MKNNKGFSLIEVLAIVVIIGIISGIAVVNLTKIKQNKDSATSKTLNRRIENATYLYAGKYYADKIVNREVHTFTLNDLEEDGLLDLANGECTTKKYEIISFNNNGYMFNNIKDDNCYK